MQTYRVLGFLTLPTKTFTRQADTLPYAHEVCKLKHQHGKPTSTKVKTLCDDKVTHTGTYTENF